MCIYTKTFIQDFVSYVLRTACCEMHCFCNEKISWVGSKSHDFFFKFIVCKSHPLLCLFVKLLKQVYFTLVSFHMAVSHDDAIKHSIIKNLREITQIYF